MTQHSENLAALRCPARPAVAFVTMGCAKNEVDTRTMSRLLAEAGYGLVDAPEAADVVVVNTCSFIQPATEESIDAVFEAAGLPAIERGEAKLIVAGCMPARYGAELEGELGEADAFLPCAEEGNIVEVVESLVGAPLGGGSGGVSQDSAQKLRSLRSIPQDPARTPDGSVAIGGHVIPNEANEVSEVEESHAAAAEDAASVSGRAPFAYVKISDGCDRFCSYCTIPYIRGRYHSFSFEEVRAEVERAIDEGAREIVLIAQDTGRWGADFEEPSTLARLMACLADEFADTWFRVMYLQPEGITDELLDVMAGHANICDYLDIPLQHVDPLILKAMNRTGCAEEFSQLIERIRTRIPDISLRTTFIAGFPGETEEQFESLCSFVEEAGFDYVGVFPYSREEGTRSYGLPNQLDEDEKRDRAQRVRDLADAVCVPRIAAREGLELDVLVEGAEEDGQRFGRAMCQAPEVDGSVYVDAGEPGDIVRVRIAGTLFYEMEGEVL